MKAETDCSLQGWGTNSSAVLWMKLGLGVRCE